jgi:hypothetical protein
MASKRVFWNRFGRYFGAVVIAAFFLPFFGVSCDGMDVITVSGTDMVGGCKPGGLIADADEQEGRHGKRHHDDGDMDHGSSGGSMGMSVDNVQREPLAIVALALALVGFGVAWMRNKNGLKASFAVSIVTLGVLVALYIKVGGELKDAIDKEKLAKGGGEMAKDITRDSKVDAGGRYGLWLTALLLVSIAGITGKALREPETMPVELPPAIAQPPAGPPPA